jgi:hypothetical protein
MTQEDAIKVVELTLTSSNSQPGVIAMLFAEQKDYDRVQDAFTDIGYDTFTPSSNESGPYGDACRCLASLTDFEGDAMKLLVLTPTPSGSDAPMLRPRRMKLR